MLWIMFNLGFPPAAINKVKNLYEDATVHARSPFRVCTQKIPIERGTIQGDSLPPLLFILFMEPLLQWLHVGGHGYKYNCKQGVPCRHSLFSFIVSCIQDKRTQDTHLANIVSSALSADDLTTSSGTNTMQNQQLQS